MSNFKIFVSGARTFKFGQDVDLKSLISYLKKNFGLGPPFGRGGLRSVKILQLLFLKLGPSNLDRM